MQIIGLKKLNHTLTNINAIYLLLVIFTTTIHSTISNNYDVTVVGPINFNASIGRQSIGLIDCLTHDLKVNHINTRGITLDDAPASIINILNNPPGKSSVAILEDLLTIGEEKLYEFVPNSKLKFAYTMFETTKIIPQWVDALNTYFDAAIVPDSFLVNVYKNSGVTIPIFVVPLGIYIDEFLEQPLKQHPGTPFVFGCSTTFEPRKNNVLLLESFIEEFRNTKKVILKLHGRSGSKTFKILKEILRKRKIRNVKLELSNYTWNEYLSFMKSLDCFVSISKGEGFSITPREALALGIPSIVSNNTAQKTICASGLVLPIETPLEIPAFYPKLSKQPVGTYFTCNKEEVKNALRRMYTNYEFFLKKAHLGRFWVQQFRYQNLKQKYLTLLKPKQIILGQTNCITDDCLITDSETLYRKYISILQA